jgi:hypothetical protein
MARDWQSMKESQDINVKWETKGQEIEGTYKKVLEGQGKQQNSCVYTIETEEGVSQSFWGTKVLDDQLSNVEIGSYIKVIYKGKVKAKSGGMQYHDFEVLVDTSTVGIQTQPETAKQAVDQPVDAFAGGEADDDDPWA